MSRTINFVRERQRNLTRLEQQDRVTYRWALIAFSVVFGVMLIAVAVRLFFLFSYQNLAKEQQNLRQAITAKQEVEKSFTVFAYKLKSLTDLFGKRKEKQETLAYFSTLFGSDVVIRQLSYSSDSEELSFNLESRNVFVLEDVMLVMQSDQMKERFPSIQKHGLSRSADGTYGMQVSLVLGERELPEAPAETTDSEELVLP